MKPCRPETLHAGDRIRLDGWAGTVLFCTLSDSYDPGFAKSDWPPALYEGLMVRHDDGACVLYPPEQLEGPGALPLDRAPGGRPDGWRS